MSNPKRNKFYITTPIYYVNAKPHIGHAYTTIAADILSRWHKLNGDDVFFLTGTDEHGLKIQKKAQEAGMEPQKFVDGISAEFKDLWRKLNIEYNYFIRTTDDFHVKAVQKALKTMYDNKTVYKGVYEGLYCVGCEQFKTENELVDGKCPDHNAIAEKIEEECYLMKMSDLQPKLIEKIEKDEFRIAPTRYKNEILAFLKSQTLNDISISRKNVSWGVPLPFDTSHTTYVWVDAFLNYLTGIKWDGGVENIPKEWPADVHLIGKDILRVHATIWPIILMHLGIETPKMLFTHGHIIAGGKKMSKSLGNAIAIEDMISKFGVDGTRYILMSAGTFGEDVDLTMERAAEIYEADLVNGLGNLVSRVLTMIEKYFDGKIPTASISIPIPLNIYWPSKKLPEIDSLQDKKSVSFEVFWDISNIEKKNVEELALNKCLYMVINRNLTVIDTYIDHYKPFKLIKEDEGKAASILYNCAESIRLIAWYIRPFMPETSDRIFSQLFDNEKERTAELSRKITDAQVWGGLESGTKIKKGENLFPRLNK